MLVTDDKKISMTDSEWSLFFYMTQAPWRPRTVDEFQAMCNLAIARMECDFGVDNFMALIAVEQIMFTPEGKANFPMDKEKIERMKITGKWPSDEEMRAQAAAQEATPSKGLHLVGKTPIESTKA